MGWPYVWGAVGRPCTVANRKAYMKSKNIGDGDRELIQKRCQVLNESASVCDGCKYYPDGSVTEINDCQGFVKQVFKAADITLNGGGCTSMWKNSANWKAKGVITEMPDVVCCVFKQSGSKMEHTGMHIGGGRIIHCSSGVQEGKTTDRGWTHYAIPAGLYEAVPAPEPAEPERRTLRTNCRGDDVKQLQEKLADLGYNPGTADGIFGSRTCAAVKSFQADRGLAADGVVGPLTWAALDAAKPADPVEIVTYRVTIDGVTWEQYRKILEICPLADAIREG